MIKKRTRTGHAAWIYVNNYLYQWGVDRLPLYSGGKQIALPPLSPRIEYALRRIGGLQALHQMDISKMPFIYRDFCEAYNLAPLAEQMVPRLEQQLGEPKTLAAAKKMDQLKSLASKPEPATGG